MLQIVAGGSFAPNPNSTRYHYLFGGEQWGSNRAAREIVAPVDGTISLLRVDVTAAPGISASRTFTLLVNGSPAALSVTIANSETSAEDTSDSVAISAGDRVCLRQTISGSPATSFSRWGMQWEGDMAIGGSSSNAFAYHASNTLYNAVLTPGENAGTTTQANATKNLWGADGTLKALAVHLSAAPGAGNSVAFTIMKNGSEEASSTVTISGTDTSGIVTGLTIDAAGGDFFAVRVVPTGSPSTGSYRIGLGYTLDDGGWQISGSSTTAGVSPYYELPNGGPASGFRADESEALSAAGAASGSFSWSVTGITVACSDDPGGTASRTYTVRKNGADADPTATINSGSTTATGAGTVSFTSGDYFSLKMEETNVPVDADSWWAFPAAAVAAPSLAVTGTVVPSATEQEVRDGAETIILTLTGGTWAASIGDCNEITEALIDGLVSDQNETHGWNNVVRGGVPYDTEVLADSPLTYWRLQDTSDNSGNAHAIDTVGSGATEDVESLLIGDSNLAVEFDGANPGLTVTTEAALENIFDGGGTAEAMIMPFSDGESDNGRIVSKGNIWALAVYEQSGGFCRLYFRHSFSTTTGLWQTTQVIPMGVATHVAVTYDNSSTSNDPTLYINSVPYTVANGLLSETSTPVGTRESDAGEDIYIGGFGTDVLRFRGRIDEVALYTSVLTQARLLAHVTAAYHPVGLTCDHVVRTSDTVVTITMPAFSTFDITIDETITVTAPTVTHSGTEDLVGSPTFDIITDGTITTEPPPDPDPGPDPGFEFPDDVLDVGFDQPFGRILRIEVAEISPTSEAE